MRRDVNQLIANFLQIMMKFIRHTGRTQLTMTVKEEFRKLVDI